MGKEELLHCGLNLAVAIQTGAHGCVGSAPSDANMDRKKVIELSDTISVTHAALIANNKAARDDTPSPGLATSGVGESAECYAFRGAHQRFSCCSGEAPKRGSLDLNAASIPVPHAVEEVALRVPQFSHL